MKSTQHPALAAGKHDVTPAVDGQAFRQLLISTGVLKPAPEDQLRRIKLPESRRVLRLDDKARGALWLEAEAQRKRDRQHLSEAGQL